MSGTASQHGPAMPLAGTVPEWVHLLPEGDVTGRDGRRFSVKNPRAIIDLSMCHAVRGQLPVDYNHGTDHALKNGTDAPAAGWIVALEARPSGIWGRVQWTPQGRARVEAREYRFISPVLMHTPAGEVTVLLRAALTNTPNLVQLTALNTAGTPMDPEKLMMELRELLKLPATATAEEVLAAVREMATAKNSADPSRFVPIELFERAVKDRNSAFKGVTARDAERAVDDAIRDKKMPSYMRDWAVALCSENAPAFASFIEKTGPQVHGFFTMLETPAFPGRSMGAEDRSRQVDAIAANLGLTAEDIKKYGG